MTDCIISIESFLSHLPEWGGRTEFEYSRSMPNNYQRHSFINTWTNDYLLLCLWTSYTLNPEILALIEEFQVINKVFVNTLFKVINFIQENQWNMSITCKTVGSIMSFLVAVVARSIESRLRTRRSRRWRLHVWFQIPTHSNSFWIVVWLAEYVVKFSPSFVRHHL